MALQYGDNQDDSAYDECGCGMDDCPQCDKWCWQCGGEGWGVRGDDWMNDDPVNDADGVIERCPCCHGSGKAKDCCYW